MRKHLFLTLAIGLIANFLFAQVGVNNTDPKSSLDITASNSAAPSNTDGILIPRIDTFPSTSPGLDQHGMMVFLTTAVGLDLPGFYYWDNDLSNWITISVPIRINDLVDGKSDYDGSNNGSSIFLGINAGINDDGTDNQNVGIGLGSMRDNIDGRQNVAIGNSSLNSTTTGNYNVAVGYQTLFTSTANNSTAIGYKALKFNTTAGANTAVGREALTANTTGGSNTSIGAFSSLANTIGIANVAVGARSLQSNVSGDNNIAIGRYALNDGQDADRNIGIGTGALNNFNSSGTADNVAIGFNVGYHSDGVKNIFLGARTGFNADGIENIFIGNGVGLNNLTGNKNVVLGHNAGSGSVGDNNVYIGFNAADSIAGNQNIFIGNNVASDQLRVLSNTLWINNSINSKPLIYGEFDNERIGINWDTTGAAPSNTLSVNGDASKTTAGDWLANSDRRLKKDIETIPSNEALSLITQLRGVTYKWNDNQTGIKRPNNVQYGFIAQEIKEVFPERVSTDNAGYYQTAYGSYDALYVQAFKELQKQLEEKTKDYDKLEARLELLEAKLGLNTPEIEVAKLKD
ncbi:hypothetical protein KH5_15440 [Urechidicola sp. KH5]